MTVNLLLYLRNKGLCEHTKDRTKNVLATLREFLTESEHNALSIAISHYEIGEGREEADHVINSLIKKYSNYTT